MIHATSIVRPTTVAIVERRGNKIGPHIYGTGLVLEDDCYVVTARHVIRNLRCSDFAVLRLFNRANKEARGWGTVTARYYHPGATYFGMPVDLALIEVQWNVKKEFPAAQPADLTKLSVGLRVGLLGWPFGVALLNKLVVSAGGAHPSLTAGVISAIRPHEEQLPELLQLDLVAHEGSSGGPVFAADDGSVVGILTHGYPIKGILQLEDGKISDTAIPTGLEFAEPVHKAIALLRGVQQQQIEPSDQP